MDVSEVQDWEYSVMVSVWMQLEVLKLNWKKKCIYASVFVGCGGYH